MALRGLAAFIKASYPILFHHPCTQPRQTSGLLSSPFKLIFIVRHEGQVFQALLHHNVSKEFLLYFPDFVYNCSFSSRFILDILLSLLVRPWNFHYCSVELYFVASNFFSLFVRVILNIHRRIRRWMRHNKPKYFY